MKYNTGIVYGCIEINGRWKYDEDFITQEREIHSSKDAILIWKDLCNKMIDYIGNDIKVDFDEDKFSDVDRISCLFLSNGQCIGYATLRLYNR